MPSQVPTTPKLRVGAPQGAQAPGLPPTGLQRQMQSLNQYYSDVRGARGGGGSIGFDPRERQNEAVRYGGGELSLPAQMTESGSTAFGRSSLQQLARTLAGSYGLPVGRGQLVDEQGNFLLTPDQLANASGGKVTLGEAAAKMNYVAQAVARRQNEMQQQKGIAAVQAGMGLVKDRGRGSAALLQEGAYRDLADIYTNQEYESADFSYFIQKERLDIQRELMRRAEKMAKKRAMFGMIGSVLGMGLGGIFGGFGGAMQGGQLGGGMMGGAANFF